VNNTTNLKLTNKFAYVGKYAFVPSYVEELSAFFHRLHPLDFNAFAQFLPERAYYNNTLFLDLFPAANIIFCTVCGMKAMDQHPLYEKWKNELSTGEFWTFIKYDWPTKGGTT
jgi:hypothetical protein